MATSSCSGVIESLVDEEEPTGARTGSLDSESNAPAWRREAEGLEYRTAEPTAI